MAALAALERLLERVFERSAARVFRTRIQAVQLERRVERAMERGRLTEDRLTEGHRTIVPNRYRVRLHPSDLAQAAASADGADALAGRLADGALVFARAHGYHLGGRPVVSLVADPSLSVGQVQVEASMDPSAAVSADAGAAPEPPRPEGSTGGSGGPGDQTMAFRRPTPAAARAVIRAFTPDGDERAIEVDGTPLAIGRAPDNGLVLADGRASRHHGRIQARRGALVYTDLGSTNGSRVNGVRVDEIVLGHGDRLQVGDTLLVVELVQG
jgi:Protein of unknown function (DUF3662)/Inner membrane component of T3SS, cytoplasmic domain